MFTNISLDILDNEVSNNKAIQAFPGIAVIDANEVVILNNKFLFNNLAAGYNSNLLNVGGLKVSRWKIGNALIEGNLFHANQGLSGALSVDNGNLVNLAKVIGNTFVGNQSLSNAGGSIWMQAQGDVVNNVFIGDQYGIRIKRSNGQPTMVRVDNNNYFDNHLGLLIDPPTIYKTIDDLNSSAYAQNNLSQNPLFRNGELRGFHLSSLSSMANKADCREFISGIDFDGESRPLAGDCDIGADEYSIQSPVSIGLWNPNTSDVYLRISNTPGNADFEFQFGNVNSGWISLAGDWDGDGIATVGFYRPDTASFYLRNSNSAGAADLVFRFGPANSGWLLLAGDWDGIK